MLTKFLMPALTNTTHHVVKIALLSVLSGVLFATPVWAAAGGEGNPWLDLLWKAMNTSILMGILFFVARKPLGNALANAAKKEKDTWDDAQRSAQQADADLAAHKKRLHEFEQEIEQIQADMRKQLDVERKRMLDQAKEGIKRVEKDMALRAEQEAVRLRQQIRREMAEKALSLAEQKVREELNQEKALQVMEKSIAQMEAR